MKEIELTQGKVAIVDDEDYEFLMQWKWYALKKRTRFYAVRNIGKFPNQTLIEMHQLIMNTPNGMETNHRDDNTLNNTRGNLRICTRSQSMLVVKNSTNTSGYRGVYCRKGKWIAQIRIDGKVTHLGIFLDIEEAARVYDEAAKEHYGEFAVLNFPNGAWK